MLSTRKEKFCSLKAQHFSLSSMLHLFRGTIVVLESDRQETAEGQTDRLNISYFIFSLKVKRSSSVTTDVYRAKSILPSNS